MTTDELSNLYHSGQITYWDYLFCFYLLDGYSIAQSIQYTSAKKPDDWITEAGRNVAKQILTGLGRSGEISSLPVVYEWKVIAEADSPKALATATPKVKELAPGTRGVVKVNTNWGVGHIFDTYGAEMFGKYFAPAGARVTDVYYEGGVLKGHGVIAFEVTGTPVLGILIAASAALMALAIVLGAVGVLVYGPKEMTKLFGEVSKWMMWGAIGLVGFGVLYFLGGSKRAPGRT